MTTNVANDIGAYPGNITDGPENLINLTDHGFPVHNHRYIESDSVPSPQRRSSMLHSSAQDLHVEIQSLDGNKGSLSGLISYDHDDQGASSQVREDANVIPRLTSWAGDEYAVQCDASQRANNRDAFMRLQMGMKDPAEDRQAMQDQLAASGDALQEELVSLQDEHVELLADKQTYTHTSARSSAELDELTTRFEDALANGEELRRRLADVEGRRNQENAMEREMEIERDSMDRMCNVLTNIVNDVKAKHQEVDRLFERSSTTIPTALNINTVGQSDRMIQAPFTEPQEARGPLSAFRRRSDDICDDIREQENISARTEHNSSRDPFDDGPTTPMAGPSDVISSSHWVHSTPIAPVRKPVDSAKEFKFNSKEELVKIVRVLNEQMALVARTATILTSPTSVARGEARPGRRGSAHPYLHSRLLDILGVDLFHRLQIRTEDDTQNPSDQVERAIQATFFYLLSIFARTWSLAPSALTSNDVLGNKTGRRKPSLRRVRPIPNLRRSVHEVMVSDTMLFINEILVVAGLSGSENQFEQYMRNCVDTLWRTAQLINENLKDSDPEMNELYRLLLYYGSYRTKIEGT